MEILLKTGESFGISPEDTDLVAQYSWHLSTGYVATTNSSGRQVFLHNLILAHEVNMQTCVDHLDGNKLNNTRQNLRVVTRSHNIRRAKRSNNQSGVIGVHRNRHGTWTTQFALPKGKALSRSFKTFEEAVLQRRDWEAQYCKGAF